MRSNRIQREVFDVKWRACGIAESETVNEATIVLTNQGIIDNRDTRGISITFYGELSVAQFIFVGVGPFPSDVMDGSRLGIDEADFYSILNQPDGRDPTNVGKVGFR